MTGLGDGEGRATPPRRNGPLWLSEDAILSLNISAAEVISAVERILARSASESRSGMKATVRGEHGDYYQALPSLLVPEAVACVKWVTVAGGNGFADGGSVRASLLLTSCIDGAMLAVMSASWITAVRTAAMSALASRALASKQPSSVGFVGCGAQAKAHLDALLVVHPSIRHVTAFSRTQTTASEFCEFARGRNLDARVAGDRMDAVTDQDILVTSVPAATRGDNLLDARHLKPGAFVSMVDLGRSWIQESLPAFEIMATDDIEQSVQLAKDGKLAWTGPYTHDLRALIGPSRLNPPTAPRAFIFGGMGICDAAIAWCCYQRADALKA